MGESGWTTIRPARADEAAAIADLVRRAYAIYAPLMDRPPAPVLADYTALIERGVVDVLPDGDRLVGVLVEWPEGDHLFIENIAVDPADQGKGLGRRLLRFAEAKAGALGLVAIELYTNVVMTENLAFYARLGFVEVDRRQDDGYQRVFLRKAL